MATKNELTLEEFLNLPQESGIYELIDGEAVFKVSPKEFHSTLTFALTTLLSRWAKSRGRVRLEWAIALHRNGKTWAPTPDVTYVSYERLPRSVFRNHACPVAPELVIEIISPDQTFKQLEAKAKDYFIAGWTMLVCQLLNSGINGILVNNLHKLLPTRRISEKSGTTSSPSNESSKRNRQSGLGQ